MDSPSRKHLESRLNELEHFVKVAPDLQYKADQTAKDKDEFARPDQEARWKVISQAITAFRQEQSQINDILNKGKCTLGSVFAASGLKEQPPATTRTLPSTLDWALITPKNREPGPNTIPPNPFPSAVQSLFFEEGSISPNTDLFKVGYTSGFRHGQYGGLAECRVATCVSDVGRVEKITVTFEHTILARRPTDLIAQPGDSGALVFNLIGGVVGLLFGVAGDGERGLFTHSRDLLESMREVTGVKEIRLRGGWG
ncbi:hypothetical protein BJX61DRAFT_515745 [Aspergillus egyptiacus]|nr:hypothetical protein BJX61DRAFT_515745 [Aspergillus egyptiacus]